MQTEHLPRRQQLAEQAAQRALAGQSPGPVLPRLRLVTTAELLCPAPPPTTAIDLTAELQALCTAVQQAVRRRPGWLYLGVPDRALPVAVRPRLLRAAVLCALRTVLAAGGNAALTVQLRQGDLMLCLRGGRGASLTGDAAALWRHCAAEGGGQALLVAGGAPCAVLRLPLRPDLACCPAPSVQGLVRDRLGLVAVYLDGFCVGE